MPIPTVTAPKREPRTAAQREAALQDLCQEYAILFEKRIRANFASVTDCERFLRDFLGSARLILDEEKLMESQRNALGNVMRKRNARKKAQQEL